MTHSKAKSGMKVIQGGNQMSLIRDTEEVTKFLEFAARKSILNEQSVTLRLTACHNLFSVVNEEEDNVEYMLKNLDVLVNRFRNKSKTTNEATLKVYKSRLKSSLEDYRAWSTDPFAWERALTEKVKAKPVEARKPKKTVLPKKVVPAATEEVMAHEVTHEVTVTEVEVGLKHRRLSLPIRNGLSIEVTLPEDGLTLKEYQRIGMYLYPYCNDVEFSESNWSKLH